MCDITNHVSIVHVYSVFLKVTSNVLTRVYSCHFKHNVSQIMKKYGIQSTYNETLSGVLFVYERANNF